MKSLILAAPTRLLDGVHGSEATIQAEEIRLPGMISTLLVRTRVFVTTSSKVRLLVPVCRLLTTITEPKKIPRPEVGFGWSVRHLLQR